MLRANRVSSRAPSSVCSPAQLRRRPRDYKAAVLDINTASKADFMALPGIGEAYSQKIIAGRPYKTKDELVAKQPTKYNCRERLLCAANGALLRRRTRMPLRPVARPLLGEGRRDSIRVT